MLEARPNRRDVRALTGESGTALKHSDHKKIMSRTGESPVKEHVDLFFDVQDDRSPLDVASKCHMDGTQLKTGIAIVFATNRII